jgi:predicted RNase H-like HicB family nuclease
MLRIEVEEETDGRFIAEVPDLPGVMAYGQSRDEAIVKVEALALRVLVDSTNGTLRNIGDCGHLLTPL